MNFIILNSIIVALGFLSYLLTSLIRNFALRKKIFDIPNERSSHSDPTPRGGGIAITLSWYIGITVLFADGIIDRNLYFALLCGIILAFVSLLDDLKDLKPTIRLIFHFLTVIMAFYFLGGIRPLVLSNLSISNIFIIYPLTIIGMVWLVNLFNFMDGIDGFASVEVISVACVLFVMSWNIMFILLIACVTGFLCWNWPRAKIFMGDVGSTQLGFILVVLGIYFHNTSDFSILNWIMLTSPFWFDATFTLIRRLHNTEKLGKAHKSHVYQRLVQAGFSHGTVDIFLILLNLFIIMLIIIYKEVRILQIPVFVLSVMILYLITKVVDRMIPFKKEHM